MEASIKTLSPKKLVGKRIVTCQAENQTAELWKSFMQNRKLIKNNLTNDLFSMQVYDDAFDIRNFNPNTPYEKWAAAEVANFDSVPEGMETYALPGGLYAVFLHRGGPATGPRSFQYIFGTWVPASAYELDNRPHFEILGEKYKNNDPDSEEEIWIAIKPKVKLFA